MTQGSDARSGGPPIVRLRGISRHFGQTIAVQTLDLDIHRGDFFAILGPSGCGKTTLLRIIGGFLTPTTGRIEIGGVDVTRLGPERRPTNMVFQGYGLFPHMSVRQNVAYGLRIAKRPAKEINERVSKMLALVHLDLLADRMSNQLSGGQQQRVALARALVMEPDVLLLDEPLGALDLQLRKTMQEELRRIHRSIGGTFVFVTHDQGEALGLANRIAVMQDGVIVQGGGPEEIYSSPATRFVATFIGDANLLPGIRTSGRIKLECGASLDSEGPDGRIIIVVRPEAISIRSDNQTPDVTLEGRLLDVVFLGTHVKYKIQLEDGREIAVHEHHVNHHRDMAVGDRIAVCWDAIDQRILDDH